MTTQPITINYIILSISILIVILVIFLLLTLVFSPKDIWGYLANTKSSKDIEGNEIRKNYLQKVTYNIESSSSEEPSEFVDLMVNTKYAPRNMIPSWDVNFTIKADPPSILYQIENVTYHLVSASPAQAAGTGLRPSDPNSAGYTPEDGFLLQKVAAGGS